MEPLVLLSQHERLRSVLPRGHLKKKTLKDFVWPAHFELPEDFKRITGVASYLENGVSETVGFDALPDEAAFRTLVNKTLEFNGEDADFEDFGTKVTIQGKPRTEEVTSVETIMNPDGTVKERITRKEVQTGVLSKAYIAYLDGLAVGGSEFAFQVTGDTLRKDMEIGRDWDWGYLSFPQRLPRNSRTTAVDAWARANELQLQRRDGEADFTFGLRNSVLSLHQEWRERLWLDGELLKCSTNEPTTPKKHWEYRLSLAAAPDTTLAKQIRELRSVSVPKIEFEGTPVCTVTVGARLPETYRRLLQPLISQIGPNDSLLQTAVLQLLESGRLSGQVVVFLDPDRQIVVNAAGALGAQTLPLKSLANLLGGVLAGDSVQAPLPLRYMDVELPLMTFADVDGGSIRVSMGRPSAESLALPDVTSDTNPKGVLLSISGDLSPLLALPLDHPSSEVVRQLELFHHSFEFPKMTSGKITKKAQEYQAERERVRRLLPSSPNFMSLRDRFSADEDFSFEVEVKTDSRSRVNVSVRVGEGLWTYWRCRTLLLRESRFRF